MSANDISLYVCIFFVVFVIIVILIIMLRKKVVVASLAIATDKDHYKREETVNITGDLNVEGEPEEGQEVQIKITKPGDGEEIDLTATTDSEGKFAAEWPIPSDAEGGVYKLDVTCLGVKASRTFTLSRMII